MQCLILITWIIGRKSIVEWGVKKAQVKLQSKGITLTTKPIEFDGIFGIHFHSIAISNNKITGEYSELLNVESLSVSLNFWNSLLYGLSIDNLEIINGEVRLLDSAGIQNFKLNEKNQSEVSEEKDKSGNAIFDQIKSLVGKSPNYLNIQKFRVKYKDSNNLLKFSLPKVSYVKDSLLGQIRFEMSEFKQDIAYSGMFDKSSLTGNVRVHSTDKKQVTLPVLGGTLDFEKAEFQIKELSGDNGLTIKAMGNVSNINTNNKRISDTSIFVSKVSGDVILNVSKREITLDSNSAFVLNVLPMRLGLKYNFGEKKSYDLLFKIPQISAQRFFNSLPVGLFPNTAGIISSGSMGYRFHVNLDERALHKAIFESNMEVDKNFKILQWSKADPSKMNGGFTYKFYRNGNLVTQFPVGESNPFFTHYSDISPTVSKAILRAEDPQFFYHNGFYIDAFRSSLIHNYRLKRFARGGSTISMQLVKNVFLGRQKTLARKIEEIILVWLFEKERVVSKQRMMEVYLNVIEWGPGIFGIGQASNFYFEKHPSELTLGESTYLASLVPAPSHARWSIDSTGSVSPKWGRFHSLKNRLIALDSTANDSMLFKVSLSPNAVSRLRGK